VLHIHRQQHFVVSSRRYGFSLVGINAHPECRWLCLPEIISWISCCQSGSDVGLELLTTVFKESTAFWIVAPCFPIEAHRRFGRTVSKIEPSKEQESRDLLAYSYFSTQKMDAGHLSGTSVNLYRSTRCHASRREWYSCRMYFFSSVEIY
jgi:hypothetical protein